MNTKLVSRTFNVLLKYKEIFKNDKERGEQIHSLGQFYIDRFNDSVNQRDKQVETEIVLQSLENVKALQKLQKASGSKEFDNTLLIENCLRLLEDRIEKLKPEVVLRSFESFEDNKLRGRYVNTLLKSMRDNKFEIRRFNFVQLSQLVELIGQYQRNDLHVFFKYVLSCIEQDFYSAQTLRDNFSSFSKMIHLFVKEGFIS